MRSITKTMLRTFAGLATATALVAGGAGVASAATTSPATHSSPSWRFGCNPWQRETWNLDGSNTVNAVYQGTTYSYSITFRQEGSCLSGTMTDSYYPHTGPIHGTINGNYVKFSFRYPKGSIQGTRTFSGYVRPQWYKQWYRHGWQWRFRWVFQSGSVSGTWSETGSENGSGTFSLADHVHRACPWWFSPHASCFVF